MFTRTAFTRLPIALLALALLVAAGWAGAAAGGSLAASASPPTYDVTRTGSTYRAVSQTGTAFSGTLKSVVESAVRSLGQSGGGTVSFAAGDFDLGSDFFLLHRLRNITFAGEGMDATVIRNSSDAAADTEPFNFQDTDEVVIRDLTISAGGALRSTSDAIDFDRGNNSTVERVKITGSRAKGIIFDGKNAGWTAEGNTVRDCVITGVPSNGIELLAASNNLVERCTISDVGRDGITIGKSSTTADQPNKKSNDNTIRSNRIVNAGLNGIYVKSGDRNRILGNTVTNSSRSGSGNDGIRITSADSITCDGNTVDGNRATDDQTVMTQRYGLRIASPLCNDTVVGANDFAGNRLGPVLDQGTNTRTLPGSGATVSVLPGADAHVSADAPGKNYGTSAALRVDGSPTVRSYLRFDVGGLTGTVTKATLRVYAGSSQRTGIDAHLSPSSWAENTLTYTSAPPLGSKLGSSGRVDAGTWQTIDVTGAITGNGTYTIALTTTGSTALSLASRESTNAPQLTIETAGGTSTLGVLPGADAHVSADAPGKNYGTGVALRVDGSPTVRSYLRFDVGGLTGTVTRATLRVYANTSQSTGIDAHLSSNTWTENTVTYTSAPPLGSKLGSSGRVDAGTWQTIDVTGAITGNGSYTIALTTTGSTALSLASRESTSAPQLTIETTG